MFSEQEQNEILQDFLRILAPVIAMETVTDPGSEKMTNALNKMLELGKSDGFRTGSLGNLCGWMECGSGEKMVAVLCHLDVVPPGDLSAWNTPPFAMVKKDGYIYGRGSRDNKGPMMLTYAILKKMMEKKIPLKKRVRLLFGTAEETGCDCMKYYAGHGELPEYAFTPDSGYPLISGEKGILHFEISKNFDGSEKNPVTRISGGSVINAVPGTAEGDWDGKTVQASGISAHASTPDAGVNAILKLGTMMPDGCFLKKLLATLTRKDLDIELSDEYSELTFAPTIISGRAESVRISCDIRFPVTMRSSDILCRLHTVLDPLGCEITVLDAQEPLFFPPDSPLVKALLGVYEKVTGESDPKPLVVGGGTYAKALPSTVAFGVHFPDEEHTAHQVNERWSIGNIRKNIGIISEAILALNDL